MTNLAGDEAQAARRRRLSERLGNTRAAIPAGRAPARNYPANRYPFRASSHFLYLVGAGLEDAVLTFEAGSTRLFVPEPDADDALWHGARASAEVLSGSLGLPVSPLSELHAWLSHGPYAAPPAPDGGPSLQGACPTASTALAHALVELRLVHDVAAQAGLREAAAASVAAHFAGLAVTRPGLREWHVRAAMEGALIERGCGKAYEPIITVHGEVLHNHDYHHVLRDGDLVLADVGAESAQGWAGDITRTWPVSGRFSDSQRALYEVVAHTQQTAIEAARPGARFRDVHLAAARQLATGLCELGILRGDAGARVRDGSYALFMPHGIGHLLGLDVHDMEDLEDAAGYPTGRARDGQFGLHALRLDRQLEPGMVVTIEPGFYRIAALLQAPERVGLSTGHVDWARLADFDDVRGIRIEDDILIGTGSAEVLTAALPKRATDIEALVGRGPTAAS